MDGPRLYGVGFKSLSCACFSHALRVPCCAENQGRGKSVRCMLVILPLLLLRLRTRDKHDDTAAILTMATTRTTATTMTRSKSHTANLSRNVVPGELLKVAKTKPGVGSWPHFVQGPPPPPTKSPLNSTLPSVQALQTHNNFQNAASTGFSRYGIRYFQDFQS